jgi:hypothetical protein
MMKMMKEPRGRFKLCKGEKEMPRGLPAHHQPAGATYVPPKPKLIFPKENLLP